MTHQEIRLDAEPLEAEPTLGQLENQEPQDQIDEEQREQEAEPFVQEDQPLSSEEAHSNITKHKVLSSWLIG